MFRAEVKKDDKITHAGNFPLQVDAETWALDNAEYFPEGHVLTITDVAEALEAQKLQIEALKYLNETDWYVIRYLETKVEVPKEILTLRAEARLKA